MAEMTEKEWALEYLKTLQKKWTALVAGFECACSEANSADSAFRKKLDEAKQYAKMHGLDAAEYRYANSIADAAKKWALAEMKVSSYSKNFDFCKKEMADCNAILAE